MDRMRPESRQPSPYPSLLFHLIRLAQLVSSIIVMSILSFFTYYLSHDKYPVPRTFLVLLAVSSLTNVSVLFTAFFYHYRQLRPRLSSMINIFLTLLWMLGFALLTWNLSGTIKHKCNIDNWTHETGIMVCRIYKALEAFTITGLLATAGSLVLDFYTIRKSAARGIYNTMGDAKQPGHTRGIDSTDDFSTAIHAGETSANYREPSLEFPEYSHEASKPYKAQRTMESQNFGYNQPSEQTSYGGAGGHAMDRQFSDHGA